jgi:hypothetical protein
MIRERAGSVFMKESKEMMRGMKSDSQKMIIRQVLMMEESALKMASSTMLALQQWDSTTKAGIF